MMNRACEPLTRKDKLVYWCLRVLGMACGIMPYDWRADWQRYLATRTLFEVE
jgi:hypothetical protein